ncbi:hypothetical protein DITRI_Ditri17bG0028100 [Diplodiscus trichospermus]
MEKDKVFMHEGLSRTTAPQPTWNSCNFGMEMQTNELNCVAEQVGSCFLNPNWDNSMDQSDPFESALSSMVSSPTASNAGNTALAGSGNNVMIRELIGRLGNICNYGDISPQSLVKPSNNTNSANTSCYSTPLNSPPKLNLSMMDSQIRGSFNLPGLGNQLPNHSSLAPFSADPGFAERAARFSCLSSGRNFGGLNGCLGLTEAEFPPRLLPTMDSCKLSRVSSNQSIKVAGSQVNASESNKNSPQEGSSGSDKKNSRLSRSSSPENAEFGDSKEESSVSEQLPGQDSSTKGQIDANARKRKSIPRGKAKETQSPPLAADAKVAAENDESTAKRSKQDGAAGNAKEKTEQNGNAKAANDAKQKPNKENSKPPEPPKDYIHVRARRGQATDSHSLAERVRREKISERMKFLQDLVPGCNKVTGKAVMLDEIINYVQSLQRQVEFLSMKLATVNPRMNINMDALLSKDMFQSPGSLPHALYSMDSSIPGFPFPHQLQQGLPLNSGTSNNTETQFLMNPLNAALHKTQGLQLPPVDGFTDANPQGAPFWEDDLQSIVQMGFGQNQPQSYQGSITAGQVKIEL